MEFHKESLVDIDYETMQQLVEVIKFKFIHSLNYI